LIRFFAFKTWGLLSFFYFFIFFCIALLLAFSVVPLAPFYFLWMIRLENSSGLVCSTGEGCRGRYTMMWESILFPFHLVFFFLVTILQFGRPGSGSKVFMLTVPRVLTLIFFENIP